MFFLIKGSHIFSFSMLGQLKRLELSIFMDSFSCFIFQYCSLLSWFQSTGTGDSAPFPFIYDQLYMISSSSLGYSFLIFCLLGSNLSLYSFVIEHTQFLVMFSFERILVQENCLQRIELLLITVLMYNSQIFWIFSHIPLIYCK